MRWQRREWLSRIHPWVHLPIILALLAGIVPASKADDGPSAGPAWQQFHLTLDSGTREEIAGPLYYQEQSEGRFTQAWPPFYSHYTDTNIASFEDDFLYPLLTYEGYGQEYRWQFIQLFAFAGGARAEGGETKRTTIYPLYFHQTSSDSNENYTAVVPFYGHIKDHLMLHDVYFVMFPFYAETRKKDVVTDNYLYPVVSIRHGDHVNGWQVWPFVGRERQYISDATDRFGDTSVVPGHESFFVLWPFYYNNTAGEGTDDPEQSAGVIPFYARMRSPLRDTTSVLWPFFTWVDDRGKKYHEWEGPWPFVIFARGEGKHTDRVWPVFSQSHNDKFESDLYLWPVYQYHGYHTDQLEQKKTQVAYYLYENASEKNLVTGAEKKHVAMWPFFYWSRDPHGSDRLQVLALLEPVLPDNRGIVRNWSPLWSLWRAENNAETGAQSRSLLWNLYRRDSTPVAKKWSLLFGLVQYNYEGGTEKLRLFYFPPFDLHKRVKWSGQ